MPRKVGVLAWLNVVLVGALVLGLVYGLRLFPRLNAAQRVVDGLKPAFAPARVAGERAGINYTSAVVDLLDPIATPQGKAASEVLPLVNLVAQKTGLPPAAVIATLQSKFPHVLGLLQALPLSAVSDELPAFVQTVATVLKTTPAEVVALLHSATPHLAQAIDNLTKVTSGWNNVPAGGLTRFDGTPVMTAPQLRDYFSQDVVPVVEKHKLDFGRVATYWPPVKYLPPLLTAIGGIAILFGLLMMLRAATGKVGRKEGNFTWSIVLILGIGVLVLVFGAQIYPRLDGGSHLLRDAAPAFYPPRVTGDVAGIKFVSNVVDLGDPIMNPEGGAEGDITKLLDTVSQKTGIAVPALVATLQKPYPHTVALLQAIPLSKINSELNALVDFLHVALNVTPDQVVGLLKANTPGLAQSITALSTVVNGWDNFPGGQGLTRFNGTPVKTAPQLRDFFADDVIGAVSKVDADFIKLNGTAPDLTLFPGLLTILGALVVIYGIIMLMVVHLPDPEEVLEAKRNPLGRKRDNPRSRGD